MEDTKRIVAALFACCVLAACGGGEPKPAPRSTESARAESGQAVSDEMLSFGNHLYRNTAGAVFLKVKNRSLMHPSRAGRARDDSLYLEMAYAAVAGATLPLSGLVDTRTFRQVDDFGSYFLDTANIYIYMARPHPVQFTATPRSGEKFLGSGRDCLLHNGTLYYRGVEVEGLNNAKLSVIAFRKRDGSGFIEFITDGKSICQTEYRLDMERLEHIDNLSDNDRREIIRRFALK